MADLRLWLQISASTQEVDPLVAGAQGFAHGGRPILPNPQVPSSLDFSTTPPSIGSGARAAMRLLRLSFCAKPEWNGAEHVLIFQLETAASGTLIRFTHAGCQPSPTISYLATRFGADSCSG
jgi:hypothetical protein